MCGQPKDKPILELSEHEAAEIRFCQVYAKRFKHRTPGANRMLLINKLSKALGLMAIGDTLQTVQSPIELEVTDHDPFSK